MRLKFGFSSICNIWNKYSFGFFAVERPTQIHGRSPQVNAYEIS